MGGGCWRQMSRTLRQRAASRLAPPSSRARLTVSRGQKATPAEILSYAVKLFSPAGEALLLEALTSFNPVVQKIAQYLHDNRNFAIK